MHSILQLMWRVLFIAGWHVALGGCTLFFEDPAATDSEIDAPILRVIDAGVIDANVDARVTDANERCPPGLLANFDDFPMLGTYPKVGMYAGLDFGNTWVVYDQGQFNVNSPAVTFHVERNVGEFGFENSGMRTLRHLRVYRASKDVTLIISDRINVDIEVTLTDVNPSVDIETNWTTPSSRIYVESTETFNFHIDDICHTAP